MIDFTQLPAPQIVESLDYETLLAQRKADLIARRPALAEVLAMESEPLTMLLQESCYREIVLRQRVNDAVRASLLAYAEKTDLDNRAADFGVTRQVVTPADPDAVPPVPAVMESDERLRRRAQMALEGMTTAGSISGYQFHTLGASPEVADVEVDSPAPPQVRVTVLAEQGDGTPTQALLATVAAALSAKDVRPICDVVTVEPATIKPYQLAATLYATNGPESAMAPAAAEAALRAYQASRRKLGADIAYSGLARALHQPGLIRVVITEPPGDVIVGKREVAHCTSIALTVVKTDER